jgi:hypothetical protein
MKKYLPLLIITLTLISCETKNSNKNDNRNIFSNQQSIDIKVKIDTLDIRVNGNLTKAVLFRNNFYCMFETGRKNTSQSFIKMIVFNQKGKFIEDVFVPEEIQNMPYYDINIENDSLFVKETQFEKINLVLGEYVADLKLTNTRDFKIFKDDTYNIYATCNGEFGGTIYFQNNKTKKIYEANSTCPTVVNKIDNDYYVTNYMGHMMGFSSVLKISDPTKLQKSKLNLNKRQGSEYNKGVENLIDTMGITISTSFESNNKLYHIYSDKKGTYA